MIIVGLTGPIGHGKSTLAEAIVSINPKKTFHIESSDVISEVAESMHTNLGSIPDTNDIDSINAWLKSLPVVLGDIVHVSCSYSSVKISGEELRKQPDLYSKLFAHISNLGKNPHLATQQITRENKHLYRPFLQWLGSYLVVKVAPDIWYKEIVIRLHDREAQGVDIGVVGGLRFLTDEEVLRAAGAVVLEVYRPGYEERDTNDPTERERARISSDSRVVNNGSLSELKAVAPILIKDISAGTLRPLYQTRSS